MREEAVEAGAAVSQRLFVDVTVQGRVWLDCQRCLPGLRGADRHVDALRGHGE